MDKITLITHSSGDMVQTALQASVHLFSSKLVLVCALVGLIVSVAGPVIGMGANDTNTAAARSPANAVFIQIFSRFILLVIFLAVMFPNSKVNMRVDVLVEDREDASLTGVVNDVPFFVAVPSALVSQICDKLTGVMETLYASPTSYNLDYSDTGIGYPLKVFKAVDDIRFPNGKLRMDASNYMQECVLPKIITDESEANSLLNSIKVYEKMGDYASPAYMTYTCDDMDCSSRTFRTCASAYTEIGTSITNNIDAFKLYIAQYTGIGWTKTGTPDADKLADSIEQIYRLVYGVTGGSSSLIDGETAIVNSAFINELFDAVKIWEKYRGAEASLAHSAEIQAERAIKGSWRLQGALFFKFFKKIRAYIEAGIFVLIPILIIFALVKVHFTIMFVIVALVMTIFLVDPVFALINQQIVAELGSFSSMGLTPSFNGIQQVLPIVEEDLGILNVMTTAVFMITTFIVGMGSKMAHSSIISNMGQTAQGAANEIEGQGNVSWNNRRMNNNQSNKFDTVPQASVMGGNGHAYNITGPAASIAAGQGNYLASMGYSGFGKQHGVNLSGKTVSRDFNTSTGMGIDSFGGGDSITTPHDTSFSYTKDASLGTGFEKSLNGTKNAILSHAATQSFMRTVRSSFDRSYNENLEALNTGRFTTGEGLSDSQRFAWDVMKRIDGSNSWGVDKQAKALSQIQVITSMDAGASGKAGIPFLAHFGVSGKTGLGLSGGVDSVDSSSWNENISKAYSDTIQDSHNANYDKTMQALKEEMTSNRKGISNAAVLAKSYADTLNSEEVQRLSQNYSKASSAKLAWENSQRTSASTKISAGGMYTGFGNFELQSVERDVLKSNDGHLIETYNNSKLAMGDIKAGLVETVGILRSQGNNTSLERLLRISAENESPSSHIAQDVHSSYLRDQGINDRVAGQYSSLSGNIQGNIDGVGGYVDHNSNVVQNLVAAKRTEAQVNFDRNSIGVGGSPNYPNFEKLYDYRTVALRDDAESLQDEKLQQGWDGVDQQSVVRQDESLGDNTVRYSGKLFKNQMKYFQKYGDKIFRK